eukprot:PITA_19712
MDYYLMANDLVRFRDRIYLWDDNELKKNIFRGFHVKPYSGHPVYHKTLTLVKKLYYSLNKKKEVAEFVAKCLDCQQVKCECKHPASLLQRIMIPEWKWDVISMDLITSFPRTSKQHDSIMVVVDKLSKVIKKNLKATQDRQKSYADQHMAFKEFQVREHVYLQIKPKKISLRIGSCAKLEPRYCGPFKIIERIGPVAYRLVLPPTVKVELEGEFQPEPQCILKWKKLMLRNREIEQVKVQWKHFGPNEATWEMVDHMWAMYPSLFVGGGK